MAMEEESAPSFDPDTVMEIFKLVWLRTSKDREQKQEEDILAAEGGGLVAKKKITTANANSLKLSCELLKLFVTETIQRAALIAEAEGLTTIEATHLERILPQLLLDF
ncbi:hypothetical protein KP509_19G029700 [Ceratopteris richardii]|uniref:Centromere protein X n=1 Tax=Ceratopteris richardii TaxID=49495 RepID=A0A8T2SIU2_CERRI|nr:hypothetical protein KP509_19G029700 [Ceratopteris richardii]